MTDECTEDDNSNVDVMTRLEQQLTKQLKMCLSTRDHHKALGDVAGTNRFERLALNVTKDLDIVRLARRTPDARVPKFHYENKDFSILKSFTELGDNDLELTIVRGISYTCSNPKEIDTYVKFDFPYPQVSKYNGKYWFYATLIYRMSHLVKERLPLKIRIVPNTMLHILYLY